MNRADGKPLTTKQKRAVRQFNKRYTKAVNQLIKNPQKKVTVKASGDESETGSFEITAGATAHALIKREMVYTAGLKPPNSNTTMTTRGVYSPSRNQVVGARTRVYDNGLGSTSGKIVHEGLHSTPQEWKGGLQSPSYPLGKEPWRSGHQGPYNDAACELLGGYDC